MGEHLPTMLKNLGSTSTFSTEKTQFRLLVFSLLVLQSTLINQAVIIFLEVTKFQKKAEVNEVREI